EPLHGDGATILQASVPDLRRAAAAALCQLTRNPVRVGVSFADLQQHVLTGSGGSETELFLDAEVFRLDTQGAASEQLSVGARRRKRRLQPSLIHFTSGPLALFSHPRATQPLGRQCPRRDRETPSARSSSP